MLSQTTGAIAFEQRRDANRDFRPVVIENPMLSAVEALQRSRCFRAQATGDRTEGDDEEGRRRGITAYISLDPVKRQTTEFLRHMRRDRRNRFRGEITFEYQTKQFVPPSRCRACQWVRRTFQPLLPTVFTH